MSKHGLKPNQIFVDNIRDTNLNSHFNTTAADAMDHVATIESIIKVLRHICM